MNISEMLSQNYDINGIVKIDKTKYGSGNTYVITTDDHKYLLKDNCKKEDVEIYHYIKSYKTTIPKIYQNNKSEHLTANAFLLYEYIDGITVNKFNEKMTQVAIKKIKELNDYLKLIDKNIVLRVENDWDKIRANEYLVEYVPERIMTMEFCDEWKVLILDCINYLKKNNEVLNRDHYQLVHIDLGPDNFLVKDNRIVSILDFTPSINFELMSLAHFAYWNYLWFETNPSKRKLKEYLRLYNGDTIDEEVETFFKLSLIIACLYRVVGLLFDMENQGSIDTVRLLRRINILEWIKKNFIDPLKGDGQ